MKSITSILAITAAAFGLAAAPLASANPNHAPQQHKHAAQPAGKVEKKQAKPMKKAPKKAQKAKKTQKPQKRAHASSSAINLTVTGF